MDHYVQYRNPALVGGSCMDGIGEPFVIGTNKGLVHRLLGQQIWLICGQGRPRRYFLRNTFWVDDVGEDGPAAIFRFYAQGERGHWFDPPLPLDGYPWFAEFRRRQSNFSFGLNPIPEGFVPFFTQLL
ncbi:MAG: hypothetical protein KF832_06025 [Caldilineaceae bacterium]|nr:hypothetical protein [Caldilineaceae bacterium]